ncbi:MAG TPA: hypothetical protein VGN16_21155 [Acidobacteriaceae bacterium]|jgi:hypothetical protein
MAKATMKVTPGDVRTYAGPTGLTAGLGVIQGASDGVIALPSAANGQCLGVIAETDQVGTGVYGIVRRGECYATCGAALTAPVFVKMDATGKFIPTSATGDNIFGRAVSSTVASGDEFVLEISPFIK